MKLYLGALAGVLFAFFLSCTPPQPLKIGFIGPLSGASAEIGGGGRNCVQIRFDEFNLAGGLQGRPLELVPLDDENNRDKALAALKSLEEKGINIVIAQMNSGASDLMVEYANQKGILLFSPIISSAVYEGKDDWFLRAIPTAVQFGNFMATTILPDKHFVRPAFIKDSGNSLFADSINKGLVTGLKTRGQSLVYEGASKGLQDLDTSGLAASLKAAGADSLVAIYSPLDLGVIAQKLSTSGVKIPLILSPWSLTPDFIKNAGSGSEGTLGVSMVEFNSTNPGLEAFRAKYRERYQGDTVHTAIMAYETAGALIQALEAHPQASPAGVKKALLKIGNFKGLTGDFTLDSWGDSSRPLHYYEVSGGSYVKRN